MYKHIYVIIHYNSTYCLVSLASAILLHTHYKYAIHILLDEAIQIDDAIHFDEPLLLNSHIWPSYDGAL